MWFSIIVPVYNRPDEVKELLESLLLQTYRQFEVILVDDGSEKDCREIAGRYSNRLTLSYYWKENSGPGPARNYGAEKSNHEYMIFLDSDCIIPPHYMSTVNRFLSSSYSDLFGGPDRAHASFSLLQKAINYSMTSFLTTGGIRGGRKHVDKFYPRSFNMGISRNAFETVGGFSDMRFGEDVDLSLHLDEMGFDSVLIEDAYVYHKRRTSLRSFFKQVFNSGMARYNLSLRHDGSLKWVHLLPAFLIIYLIISAVFTFWYPLVWLPLIFATVLFFLDALRTTRSLPVALLSSVTSIIQIAGYGSGFIWAVFKRKILGRQDLSAFDTSFYD